MGIYIGKVSNQSSEFIQQQTVQNPQKENKCKICGKIFYIGFLYELLCFLMHVWGKPLPSLVPLLGFLSSVCSQMFSEITTMTKGFVTFCTFIRSLSSMNSLVLSKM